MSRPIRVAIFKTREPMSQREIADELVWRVGKDVIQVNEGELYLPREEPYSSEGKPGADWKERKPICLFSDEGLPNRAAETELLFISTPPNQGTFLVNAEMEEYVAAASEFAQNIGQGQRFTY